MTSSTNTPLTPCQPLQLPISPSLLSNNLSTPIIYAHKASLLLLPHRICASSSSASTGATAGNNNNASSSADDAVVTQGEKQYEHTLRLKRKIMAFDFTQCVAVSSDPSKQQKATPASPSASSQNPFNDAFISIALENGISIWDQNTQKMIYHYEFEDDEEYANTVLVVPQGVVSENHMQQQQRMIVLASSRRCLCFSLNRTPQAASVQKLSAILPCFGMDQQSGKNSHLNIIQLAASRAHEEALWISDAHGRIQLFDYQNMKPKNVNIGAFSYIGGKPMGFEFSDKDKDAFAEKTDVLSARPVELGRYLVCAYVSGVIRLFDVDTGAIRAEVNAHVGPIRALALQPLPLVGKASGAATGGGIIASASEDQHILLWKIGTSSNDSKQLSIELIHQQYVKDCILTGLTWLNERTIGATAYEKKVLHLFKMP